MTTITQVGQSMQVILHENAHQIGRTSGFVQRQSKFGGAELAQTLVFGWLANPQASLEELAQTAAEVGIRMSAQGLDQRLGERAADCLQQVLHQAAQQMVQAEKVPLSVWEHFTGVYVQDSTCVSLPEALADVWPGCGGGHTPGDGAATLKVQVQWELQGGQLSAVALQAGRTADRTSGEWLARLPAGALGLADLGYFSLERMAAQAAAGSYWLSQVQAGTCLVEADGQSRSVSAWLATQTAAQVDRPIRLGVGQQLPCRLLAARVTPDVAATRRRHLRAEARRQGQLVSAERLKLADWTVFVTNVPAEWLNLDQAWVLARVRWQIELLFKLWKSHGQVDQWRSQKPWRILCEVYAKLLGQLVQHWILLVSCWDRPDRSLFKAAQTIRKHALHLASAFCQPAALEQALIVVQRCLAHGCRLNKRRSAPSTFQRLAAFDLAHG
jgi:Transposase DDE domain